MVFHVIKENDLFLVTTPVGGLPSPREDQFGYGLYTRDTRVLSQLTLNLEPLSFELLDAYAGDNYSATYRLSNKGNPMAKPIPGQSVLVTRRQIVDGTCLYEEICIENFGSCDVDLTATYEMEADFADMFEVRDYSAVDIKRKIECIASAGKLHYSYQARDGVLNETSIFVDGANSEDVTVSTDGHKGWLRYAFTVNSRSKKVFTVVVKPSVGVSLPGTKVHEPLHAHTQNVSGAVDALTQAYDHWLSESTQISGDAAFVQWYERGMRDIRMLISDIGYGPFAVAGVPWYAVPFGRDSLMTALQMLLVDPQIARGTLLTMAALQGEQINTTRDEQPGKIMHEWRIGELTRTGEAPFGPYYGSIDSTPLFLCLASEYYLWTGDKETIETLKPHIQRAFAWIEDYGDRDGDGFVEYYKEADRGISNQGWKDSGDSVTHTNGILAAPPIALCEVQGYVYRAYTSWESLYSELGEEDLARHCAVKASMIKSVFKKSFWLEEAGILALALDGEKQPVATATSNMGQTLWGGIVDQGVAKQVADRLLSPDMFSGYGIRTLSNEEFSYNPLSYHNGSIWPHDNSFIIAGFAQYELKGHVAKAAGALLGTAGMHELARLPELFGGLPSSDDHAPLPYPVSCSPQAWAAATPALVLQAVLGIRPNATRGEIQLNPVLPEGVNTLRVNGLRVGDGSLSLILKRGEDGSTVLESYSVSEGVKVEVINHLKGVMDGAEAEDKASHELHV